MFKLLKLCLVHSEVSKKNAISFYNFYLNFSVALKVGINI